MSSWHLPRLQPDPGVGLEVCSWSAGPHYHVYRGEGRKCSNRGELNHMTRYCTAVKKEKKESQEKRRTSREVWLYWFMRRRGDYVPVGEITGSC